MADVAFVLHGHFYQPPRENPWTEVVPREPSAAPYHDWNERITAECYRPNGWARILDDQGRIVAIVDNYERLSFNVGPTLLSWLEDARARGPTPASWPPTGPSAGRSPRATATPSCRCATTVTCAPRCGGAWPTSATGSGARPRACGCPRPRSTTGCWPCWPRRACGSRSWRRARSRPCAAAAATATTRLEPRATAGARPCRATARGWRHPDDPDLGVDIVVYDGADLPRRGLRRVPQPGRRRPHRAAARAATLVAVACDGETFGHHHHFADRGVAYALTVESGRRGVALPRLADWLAEHPPDPRGPGARCRPGRAPTAWAGGRTTAAATPAASRAGTRPGGRRCAPALDVVRAARSRCSSAGAPPCCATRGPPATPTSTCCWAPSTVEAFLAEHAWPRRRPGHRRSRCWRASGTRCSCTRAAAGSSTTWPGSRPCRSCGTRPAASTCSTRWGSAAPVDAVLDMLAERPQQPARGGRRARRLGAPRRAQPGRPRPRRRPPGPHRAAARRRRPPSRRSAGFEHRARAARHRRPGRGGGHRRPR